VTDLLELLEAAHRAVDIGRDLVRRLPVGRLTAKGERDMASDVDFAVERAIRGFLAERTPDIALLGEETGLTGADRGTLWALDPIDGTANFVHGLPLCAVSLGLIQGGRQVLGVIDTPRMEMRFSAAEGHGALLNGQAITVRPTTALADAIVAIGDYAVGAGAPAKNLRRMALTADLAGRVQRVRMLGTAAIDLAWLAAGWLDAAVTLSNNPWDMTAGVAIAREAGALVFDADGAEHTATSAATIAVVPGLANAVLSLVQGDPSTAQ
jgi:myo-inositol-1(or 4)-monophosphatase